MRILFVSHTLPPLDDPMSNVGGMQRVATELLAALEARDDVEVVAEVLRCPWSRIELETAKFMLHLRRVLPQRLADGRFDVVLFSGMVTAALAPWLRKRAPAETALAAIVHGLDVTTPAWPYQKLVVRRGLKALDAVLPVSRATGDEVVARGMPTERVRPLPNGVDLARFERLPARATARRELVERVTGRPDGLPRDALLLGSVGRHVERKGLHWFAEHVMPRLPAQVHWWAAGDGAFRPQVEAAIARGGAGDRIRLLGMADDEVLVRLYRGADLFVMPNVKVEGDMEGFGIVMIEAGACGLPVVAARLEGIRDVVTDGVNGTFVDSRDADGFVAAIERWVDERDALAAWGDRVADYTRETFSWDAVAGRYVDTLAEVVDRRRSIRTGAS